MRISRSTIVGLQQITSNRLSELIPARDYSDLNDQNSQLRIWIPEPIKISLDEVCEVHGVSTTVYLTEYFATYLFGHHEMLRMRAKGVGLYELKSLTKYNRESVPEATAPNLGKNIFALKIWVPKKIKDDLQSQSQRTGVTLGEFLRALICAHLFGSEYGKSVFNVRPLSEDKALDWEMS